MDFGPSARDYVQHRKGFPDSFFERLPLEGPLLDLGTGTGTLARGYAGRGVASVGLDLSLPMLRGSAGQRVAGRAEALPFRARSFASVVAGQCWHWFDRKAAAAEAARVLKPGGSLAIAHFDYLADRDGIARDTEQLILRFNPAWKLAGGNGLHEEWRPDFAGFEDVRSFWYDEDVSYSRDGWRGRIRACNAIIAIKSPEVRNELDEALADMLSQRAEPLLVPHRVFVIRGRFPRRDVGPSR